MTNYADVSAQDVEDFHRRSDVDFSAKAQHHTLGDGPAQAANGAEFRELVNEYQESLLRLKTLEDAKTAENRNKGRDTVTVTASDLGTVPVVFPKPFPVGTDPLTIKITLGSGHTFYSPSATGVTINGFNLNVRHVAASATSTTVPVAWEAFI